MLPDISVVPFISWTFRNQLAHKAKSEKRETVEECKRMGHFLLCVPLSVTTLSVPLGVCTHRLTAGQQHSEQSLSPSKKSTSADES